VLRAVNLAHLLVRVRPPLLDVLRPFEPIQEIVTERLVKVEGYAGDDLGEKGGGAAGRECQRSPTRGRCRAGTAARRLDVVEAQELQGERGMEGWINGWNMVDRSGANAASQALALT
jgi:hypothetical protein